MRAAISMDGVLRAMRALLAVALTALPPVAFSAPPAVFLLSLDGAVSPATADYAVRGIDYSMRGINYDDRSINFDIGGINYDVGANDYDDRTINYNDRKNYLILSAELSFNDVRNDVNRDC